MKKLLRKIFVFMITFSMFASNTLICFDVNDAKIFANEIVEEIETSVEEVTEENFDMEESAEDAVEESEEDSTEEVVAEDDTNESIEDAAKESAEDIEESNHGADPYEIDPDRENKEDLDDEEIIEPGHDEDLDEDTEETYEEEPEEDSTEEDIEESNHGADPYEIDPDRENKEEVTEDEIENTTEEEAEENIEETTEETTTEENTEIENAEEETTETEESNEEAIEENTTEETAEIENAEEETTIGENIVKVENLEEVEENGEDDEFVKDLKVLGGQSTIRIYNVNGGLVKKMPSGNYVYTGGVSDWFPAASTAGTKTGYTFKSWYCSRIGKYIGAGHNMSMSGKSGTYNFSPAWNENSYKVNYVLPSHLGWGSGYTAPTSRLYTKSVILPEKENMQSEFFELEGWYEDEEFTSDKILETPNTTTLAYTYYAKEVLQPDVHTITFIKEDGTEELGYAHDGAPVACPEIVLSDGVYWCEIDSDGDYVVFDFDTPIYEDMTIYSSEPTPFATELDDQEERSLSGVYNTEDYENGCPENVDFYCGLEMTNLPILEREGFDFVGWSLEKDYYEGIKIYDKNTVYNKDLREEIINGGNVLYAIWKVKEYTISIKKNGELVKDIDVIYGEKPELPSEYSADAKFLICSSNSDDSTEYFSFDVQYGYNSDIIIEEYLGQSMVLFDANAGNVGEEVKLGFLYKEVTKGTEVKEEDLPQAERKGYVLKGYSISKNDNENIIKVNNVWDFEGTTLKLYAVWEAKSYVIVLEDQQNLEKVEAKFGQAVEIPEPKTKKEGFTFVGYVHKNGEKEVLWKAGQNAISSDEIFNIENRDDIAYISFEAKYTESNYKIIFNDETGYFNGQTQSVFDIQYGQIPSQMIEGFGDMCTHTETVLAEGEEEEEETIITYRAVFTYGEQEEFDPNKEYLYEKDMYVTVTWEEGAIEDPEEDKPLQATLVILDENGESSEENTYVVELGYTVQFPTIKKDGYKHVGYSYELNGEKLMINNTFGFMTLIILDNFINNAQKNENATVIFTPVFEESSGNEGGSGFILGSSFFDIPLVKKAMGEEVVKNDKSSLSVLGAVRKNIPELQYTYEDDKIVISNLKNHLDVYNEVINEIQGKARLKDLHDMTGREATAIIADVNGTKVTVEPDGEGKGTIDVGTGFDVSKLTLPQGKDDFVNYEYINKLYHININKADGTTEEVEVEFGQAIEDITLLTGTDANKLSHYDIVDIDSYPVCMNNLFRAKQVNKNTCEDKVQFELFDTYDFPCDITIEPHYDTEEFTAVFFEDLDGDNSFNESIDTIIKKETVIKGAYLPYEIPENTATAIFSYWIELSSNDVIADNQAHRRMLSDVYYKAVWDSEKCIVHFHKNDGSTAEVVLNFDKGKYISYSELEHINALKVVMDSNERKFKGFSTTNTDSNMIFNDTEIDPKYQIPAADSIDLYSIWSDDKLKIKIVDTEGIRDVSGNLIFDNVSEFYMAKGEEFLKLPINAGESTFGVNAVGKKMKLLYFTINEGDNNPNGRYVNGNIYIEGTKRTFDEVAFNAFDGDAVKMYPVWGDPVKVLNLYFKAIGDDGTTPVEYEEGGAGVYNDVLARIEFDYDTNKNTINDYLQINTYTELDSTFKRLGYHPYNIIGRGTGKVYSIKAEATDTWQAKENIDEGDFNADHELDLEIKWVANNVQYNFYVDNNLVQSIPVSFDSTFNFGLVNYPYKDGFYFVDWQMIPDDDMNYYPSSNHLPVLGSGSNETQIEKVLWYNNRNDSTVVVGYKALFEKVHGGGSGGTGGGGGGTLSEGQGATMAKSVYPTFVGPDKNAPLVAEAPVTQYTLVTDTTYTTLLDVKGNIMYGFYKLEDKNTKKESYYFLDFEDHLHVGFVQDLRGDIYYFDPSTGVMVTGSHVIAGREFTFNEKGRLLDQYYQLLYSMKLPIYLAKDGEWKQSEDTKAWYYALKDVDGNWIGLATNIIKTMYNETTGRVETYAFSATGEMQKGTFTFNGVTYNTEEEGPSTGNIKSIVLLGPNSEKINENPYNRASKYREKTLLAKN